MVAGKRFDLDEAREQARLAKQKAQIKNIISNVVLVVVVLLLGLGAWLAWGYWQDKREAQREAAEEAERIEAQRLQRERKQREAERKAREEKRLREKREREEARQRQREEQEEKRRRAQEERERERREREEARQREREHAARQKELKEYAKEVSKGVAFEVNPHIVVELASNESVDYTVEEERWTDLCASRTSPIDFFLLLKDSPENKDVEATFSEENYPEASVIERLMEGLRKERFTLVVQLHPDAVKEGGYALVVPDREEGLKEPEGLVPILEGKKKILGWKVPFTISDTEPYYFMTTKTATQFAKDWRQFVKKATREASRQKNKGETLEQKISEAYPEFVKTLVAQLMTPPPKEEKAKEPEKKVERKRPKMTLSGSDSKREGSRGLTNTRSFATPAQRR